MTVSEIDDDLATRNLRARELVCRYYDACNRRDMEAIFECFHPNIVHHSRLSEYPKDGIGFAFEATLAAFPDMRWEIGELVVEDPRVAALVLVEGTHRGEYLGKAGDGRRVKVFSFDIARIEDGRFIEHRGVLDELHLLAQIGMVPETYLAQMS